jgi:hypothetical protein
MPVMAGLLGLGFAAGRASKTMVWMLDISEEKKNVNEDNSQSE